MNTIRSLLIAFLVLPGRVEGRSSCRSRRRFGRDENGIQHGFLVNPRRQCERADCDEYAGAHAEAISVPGVPTTIMWSINNRGEIVGGFNFGQMAIPLDRSCSAQSRRYSRANASVRALASLWAR
jgi:hypothetical protein